MRNTKISHLNSFRIVSVLYIYYSNNNHIYVLLIFITKWYNWLGKNLASVNFENTGSLNGRWWCQNRCHLTGHLLNPRHILEKEESKKPRIPLKLSRVTQTLYKTNKNLKFHKDIFFYQPHNSAKMCRSTKLNVGNKQFLKIQLILHINLQLLMVTVSKYSTTATQEAKKDQLKSHRC